MPAFAIQFAAVFAGYSQAGAKLLRNRFLESQMQLPELVRLNQAFKNFGSFSAGGNAESRKVDGDAKVAFE